MSPVHMASAAAANALKIQETHGADENGLCGFCLLHFGDRFKAGWCAPWQRAAAFLVELRRRQERFASRPPRRREAPRTGTG
jgi:hypothetical protein